MSMMVDIYMFLVFVFGLIQLYILTNIGGYYNEMKTNLLKQIVKKKAVAISNELTAIQYFNLASHFILLIGLLTPYWLFFAITYAYVFTGNTIQSKLNVSPSKISEMLTFSKYITYSIIIIKAMVMFILPILYYQGLI